MKIAELRKKTSYCLLAILLPYLAWSLVNLEHDSLYHPELTLFDDPLKAIEGLPLRREIQDVYFKTSDGVSLNAWYVPAKSGKPTVVFAHGNGGNIGGRWNILKAFTNRGYGFLAFDYRGYGKSSGKCSEEGFYRDMDAASTYLVKQGVPYVQQISMGESLGTGVAIQAALKHPYRAVIIYAAYTSTPDVAEHLRDSHGMRWLGFIPLHQIMRQHFPSLTKISGVRSPLIIMHGEKDEMMPLTMPRALFAQATTPDKKLLIIPNTDHNNVFEDGHPQLFSALDELLRKSPNKNAVLSQHNQ